MKSRVLKVRLVSVVYLMNRVLVIVVLRCWVNMFSMNISVSCVSISGRCRLVICIVSFLFWVVR